MTDTAPSGPAPAPTPAITMTPSSDEPSGDMFSDATSYHDFQSQVKERAKQQRQSAGAPKAKAPLTAAKPAQPPPPPAEMRPTAAEATETMLPPPAAPQTPVEEPAPETTPAEPTETPPVDPTQEAQEAAEQEALGKIRDWMRTGGEVPAELMDVPVQLPDGRLETWGEVMKGNMRQDDHTRGWQEMQQIKAQSQAAVQAYEQHFTQIEDPDPMKGGEAMYEVYTRGPRRAAFMEAARKLAYDEQEDITHAQGYAIAFARRERLFDERGEPLWNHRDVSKAYDDALKERERIRLDRDMGRQRDWELQRERAQNQQYQNAKKQVEVNKNVENQLAQMRPRAFKQLGIADDAETQQLFRRKLAARAEQTRPSALTPELVMEAARMTRDHLERERGNGNGHAKPAQRTYQPQLGGGGGKMGGSQKQEPMTDEEFALKFKLRKL